MFRRRALPWSSRAGDLSARSITQSILFGFSRDSAWAYPWPVEAKGGPLPTRRLRAPPVGGRYPFHQETNRIKRSDCMNAEPPGDTAKGCTVSQEIGRAP